MHLSHWFDQKRLNQSCALAKTKRILILRANFRAHSKAVYISTHSCQKHSTLFCWFWLDHLTLPLCVYSVEFALGNGPKRKILQRLHKDFISTWIREVIYTLRAVPPTRHIFFTISLMSLASMRLSTDPANFSPAKSNKTKKTIFTTEIAINSLQMNRSNSTIPRLLDENFFESLGFWVLF